MLLIIGWFIILFILRVIMPVKEVDFEIKLQYCLACSFVTLFIYYFYIRYRNRLMMKKITRMRLSNEYVGTIKYIDSCICSYPKLHWLKFEKLMTFALQGSIVEYEAYLINIELHPLKKSEQEIVNEFKNLFSYFRGEYGAYVKFQQRDDTYINKVNILLHENNVFSEQERVKRALEIYNSPCYLFKVFAALFLFEFYYESRDEQNCKMFINKAREYAISSELRYYVEEHINAIK